MFSGAEEGPRSRGSGLLNGHHPLRVENRDFKDEDHAKDATRGCGGNIHFLEKSEAQTKISVR